MDTIAGHSSSASVFETSAQDPQLAVACALSEVEDVLARYLVSGSVPERMNLLTEVEGLRRYVLVRGLLLTGLRRPARADGTSLGQLLCGTLQGLAGDAPGKPTSNSLQGARNALRDTRRAAASLAFLSNLDPAFG